MSLNRHSGLDPEPTFLPDAAKKVEQRRITAGAERGRDIVVTAGLKEGELVIVEGIQKVRPGQVVTANVVPGT